MTTSRPRELRVLLLVRSAPPCSSLAELEAAVDRTFPQAELRRLRHAHELSSLADSGWHADLVVAGQSWPDEYTATDVQSIIRAFPLARLVCCYGPWCSSDGRTRDLWPHAVRTPVAQISERLEKEKAVLAGRLPALPLTASRDECIEFQLRPLPAECS